MKYPFLLLIVLFNSLLTFAQRDVYVEGYYKAGTYVQPHYRTAPNESLFDNFSTKGNYNPYTGKAGWVEPYSRIITLRYQNNYFSEKLDFDKILLYLNNKDSDKYFRIINTFDADYKLLYTAIFKININEMSEANKILQRLKKDKNLDLVVLEQTEFWFDITERYLEAEIEFEKISNWSIDYEKNNNYSVLVENLRTVKNPLNFFFKYLVQFSAENKERLYNNAIKTVDSLILYDSEKELAPKLVKDHKSTIDYYKGLQNTLDTKINGTYFYSINDLVKNLSQWVTIKTPPEENLRLAKFTIVNKNNSDGDVVYSRAMYDTSKSEIQEDKIEYITFGRKPYAGSIDTFGIVSLKFSDYATFKYYENELLDFSVKNSAEKSILYNFRNNPIENMGTEHLMNPQLICGLVTNKLDPPINNSKQYYTMYLYCVYSNGKGKILSSQF